MVEWQEKGKDEPYTFEDLYRLIELLRSPGGCPWDREQTHASLIKPMIEEAYETVDAIEKESDEKLCEELGDVLLQVIFHSIIAEEEGAFRFDDITDGCTRKMLFRHSHVFGEDVANTAGEVLDNWDKRKQVEKGFRSLEEELQDIPKVLPALMRAAKAAKKIRKNRPEAETAHASGVPEAFHSPEEAGRYLYEVARICERSGIEPELALKAYIDKEILG